MNRPSHSRTTAGLALDRGVTLDEPPQKRGLQSAGSHTAAGTSLRAKARAPQRFMVLARAGPLGVPTTHQPPGEGTGPGPLTWRRLVEVTAQVQEEQTATLGAAGRKRAWRFGRWLKLGMPALLGAALAVSAAAGTGESLSSGPTPVNPWDRYNAGVQAYVGHDYSVARDYWGDLALETLPRGLRQPVWFQLGNVQFRLGEGREPEAPEEAIELWRRSLEAYRTALVLKPRHAATRHNLALVEARLAQRLHHLGLAAAEAAGPKLVDEAIELLRTAVEYVDEAVELQPQDSILRADRDRIRTTLREKLLERAASAEKRADSEAAQNTAWSDRQAEDGYRNALDDIGGASPASSTPPAPAGPDRAPVPADSSKALDQAAAEAGERVSHKLADLLTRMGQREQKEGQSQAEWNPDDALGRFDTALDHYQQALAAQPDHEAAGRGEREVSRAMEQLHLREGQSALKEGKQQLGREEPRSGATLTTALEHFEATLSLNANNVPAQLGAEEARRLLPEALARSGQASMQAGDKAEPGNPTGALAQFQEAETDFQRALELQPGQAQAQQGLRDVEPRLARLRERLAQEGQQNAASPGRPRSLQSLLDQVSEREPPPNGERQRQRARNRPGERTQPRDW